MAPPPPPPPPPNEPIQFARLPDGVVVIRVAGRGTHQQSPSLREVFELTRNANPAPHYVLDLDQCVSMDSTFLGTLASIAIHQRQRDGSSAVATNVNDHVRNLLETLGLKFLMEIRATPQPGVAPAAAAFKAPDAPALNRLQQIVLMLEAHETLVDLDSRNEVKFEGVLKSLRESLDREQKKTK